MKVGEAISGLNKQLFDVKIRGKKDKQREFFVEKRSKGQMVDSKPKVSVVKRDLNSGREVHEKESRRRGWEGLTKNI